MDASNLLKPALARGELHCVGATTLDEFRKHVEKDAALARRFQPDLRFGADGVRYDLDPARTQGESTRSTTAFASPMRRSWPPRRLSNRYIADRFLPDKAIDLVDEAASRLRMQVDSKPEELDELDRRILQLRIEQEASEAGDGCRVQRAAGCGSMKSSETSRRSSAALAQRWQAEKSKLGDAQKLKEQLDAGPQRSRARAAPRRVSARRRIDLWGDSRTREEARRSREQGRRSAWSPRRLPPDMIAGVVSRWTGVPVDKMLRRRTRQAAAHGGRDWRARHRPA